MKVIDANGRVHTASGKLSRFFVKGEVHDAHGVSAAGKEGIFFEVGDILLPG